MSRRRRAIELLLPSVAASLAGTLVAGLIDGAAHAGSLLRALAAVGYVGAFFLPVLFFGSLSVRGLWRAWRPREVARAATEEGGGAPRMAAWVTYLLLAGWLLVAFTFNFVLNAVVRSPAKHVQALASAIAVGVAVALLVAASYPAVRGLAAIYRALDRRLRRAGRRSPLTPLAVFVAGCAAVALLCWLGWVVSIRPRIGHLDIAPLFYLAAGLATCAGVHLGWPALRRRGVARVLAVCVVLGVAAAAAASIWVRHRRPYQMLEVWAHTKLAGRAIDQLYDIQSLRREFDMREFRPAEREGAPRHDVVLITIDTFRASRSPVYGGEAKMPALQRMAEDSVVFEWAFSPGNVTRRSMPTIATGLSPHRVRGRVAGWALRIDPRHVMVAERFRAAGYATAGFFCCGSHFDPKHRLGLIRGIEHLVIDKDGAVLVAEAKKWLDADPERPRFVWFHFIEPHVWQEEYPQGKKYGRTYGERYDHSLEEIDGFLGAISESFLGGERPEHTIVALTSDHGEALGSHGARTHATDLYNSQIRVPLLVRAPEIEPRRIEMPVGLVDLAPTLLDLAGFVPPGMPQMDGLSFAPVLRGARPARREAGEAYAVMVEDRSVKRSAYAMIVGRYKLIELGGGEPLELYDFVEDPKESENLAEEKPKVLERLRRRLEARKAIDRIPAF